MKKYLSFKYQIIFLIFFPLLAYAYPTQHIETTAKKRITTLYIQAPTTINQRIKYFSDAFLNKPYVSNPLGEGINGRFSQKPLFRTDGFDCLTYVETILALAFANNFSQFIETLQTIRYTGPIDFVHRNHFTGLDWNINVENQGYLVDITKNIKNEKQNPVFFTAIATIDKRSWYQHIPVTTLYLPELPAKAQLARLKQLHIAGNHFKAGTETVPYIPFSILFNQVGKPNLYVFNQIPDNSIIEIVRPNWDLTKQIGTHLNISHIGFAIRKNHKLIFRDASSQINKVSDRDLIAYLKKQMINSPTVKGINVHMVNFGTKLYSKSPLP